MEAQIVYSKSPSTTHNAKESEKFFSRLSDAIFLILSRLIGVIIKMRATLYTMERN